MRVGYISNVRLPSRDANSIQVMKMCEAFSSQGADVLLFVPKKVKESDVDLFEYYDVENCFEILRTDRIESLSWSPLVTMSGNVKGVRRVSDHSLDVIYCRDAILASLAAKSGIDTVCELHCPPSQKVHGWAFNTFFKLFLNSSNMLGLVTISEQLKRFMASEYSIHSESILVAHDAADDVDSEVRPNDLPGNSNFLDVGYIGNLYRGKGMEIISRLCNEHGRSNYHIVGGKEEDIDKWQRRIGGNDNVFFHGFIPQSDLDQYRIAFDVLLAPYRKNVNSGAGVDISNWMSPLKIFEYMAAGRPIIASNLPVLKEILTDGENAILCEPSDALDWVEAIETLSADPELRNQLGSTARRHYEEKHTWESRAQKLLDNIRSCQRDRRNSFGVM